MRQGRLGLLLAIPLLAWAATAAADEILPAAADSEDLKSFDQSVVVPGGQSALGQELSSAARQLRNENQASKPPKAIGAAVAGNSNVGASPNESSPANAVKNGSAAQNGGKKPGSDKPGNSKGSDK